MVEYQNMRWAASCKSKDDESSLAARQRKSSGQTYRHDCMTLWSIHLQLQVYYLRLRDMLAHQL